MYKFKNDKHMTVYQIFLKYIKFTTKVERKENLLVFM